MAKILVIDDERAIRNTLKDILEFEGYTVEVAENGRIGLECALSSTFDLIIRYFIEHKDEIKGFIEQYKVPVQSVGRWNAAPIRDGKLSCEVLDLQKNLMAAVAGVGSPVFGCGCDYYICCSVQKY